MAETTVEQQQTQAIAETAEPVEAAQEAQPTQPTEAPPAPIAADIQAKLSEAKATLEQRDAEVEALRHQLTSATARYREALLASMPEVPAELVSGATPEEVEASLAQARGMVERIRSHIEAQLAEQRVPIRSAPDLSALSPTEKIAYALSQREGQR